MNLVERIKGILLQPKSEWPAIEREPGNVGYLFPNYVASVAAIPAVCTFIGTSIIGVGAYRVGIGIGLLRAVVVYILSPKNRDNAMKVSAYAPTASSSVRSSSGSSFSALRRWCSA